MRDLNHCGDFTVGVFVSREILSLPSLKLSGLYPHDRQLLQCSLDDSLKVVYYLRGGGGKALTMTMTPWNLPHGQWSKKLTMTMTPSILAMVMVKNGQF